MFTGSLSDTRPSESKPMSPTWGARRRHRSASLRYGMVAVCLTIAFAVRFSLTPLIVDFDPFMFFAPAALIAAWFGGIGPGLVAWVGGILLGDFFFTGPLYQFGPYGPVQITLMTTYSVETFIGIALIEALHRLGQKAQQSAEEAHLRGERLERAMTERKRVEVALRLRDEQMQLITDSLPVLISYIDKDRCYQFLNRQYEIWFNLPRSEAYGKHLKAIWGKESYEEMREHVEAAFAGKDITYERWIANARGNRCNQITYVPHRGEFGAVEGLFVLVTDITEAKQSEAALRQAQEQLSKHAAELEERVAERTAKLKASLDDLERLLYSVAHDLRGPLRAMEGFSTLLLKLYAPGLDSLGRDYAKRIAEAATRMDQLILDLLAFGRLSHVTLSCHRVELSECVADVLARGKEEIKATNAQIELQEPFLDVYANETLLEQMLSNLLSNALKFVVPGTTPRVRIRTEQCDATVRLWVEDNGIGIAAEHHQKIFRLFERLHGMNSYPGTGLGLAIVAKGAERMGGRAGVESKLGEGSRFWVELLSAPLQS